MAALDSGQPHPLPPPPPTLRSGAFGIFFADEDFGYGRHENGEGRTARVRCAQVALAERLTSGTGGV